MDDKLSDLEKSFLLLEYQKIFEKICSLERISISFLTIVIALFGGAGALIAAEKDISSTVKTVLIVSVPLFINAIILFAMLYTSRTYRLGGYLAALEDKINNVCNKKIANWEITSAEYEQTNLSAVFMMLLFGLCFLIFCGLPIWKIWPQFYKGIIGIMIGIIVVFISLMEIIMAILYIYTLYVHLIEKRINSLGRYWQQLY